MSYTKGGVDAISCWGSKIKIGEGQVGDGEPTKLLFNFGSVVYDKELIEADGDGLIKVGEEFAFNGDTLTLVGSGWMKAGLSSEKQVILATDTDGEQTLVFPNGDFGSCDALMAALKTKIQIEEVGFDLNKCMPICFLRGTRLLTRAGYRPVEDIAADDVLIDRDGNEVKALWVSHDTFSLNAGSHAALFPVEIAANAFGPGQPERPLRVSQQHRIVVRSPQLSLHFALDEALAPAKGLINGTTVRLMTEARSVDYFHVLCENHAVLVAEGVETESMLLGSQARSMLDAHEMDEIDALFPDVIEGFSMIDHVPALPLLKTKEAELLTSLTSMAPVEA